MSSETSSRSGALETMKTVCTCGVCYCVYDSEERTPVQLPCGHSFCVSCVAQLSVEGTLRCPVDRTRHSIADEGFQTNFQLYDVVTAVTNIVESLPDVFDANSSGTGAAAVNDLDGQALFCKSCVYVVVSGDPRHATCSCCSLGEGRMQLRKLENRAQKDADSLLRREMARCEEALAGWRKKIDMLCAQVDQAADIAEVSAKFLISARKSELLQVARQCLDDHKSSVNRNVAVLDELLLSANLVSPDSALKRARDYRKLPIPDFEFLCALLRREPTRLNYLENIGRVVTDVEFLHKVLQSNVFWDGRFFSYQLFLCRPPKGGWLRLATEIVATLDLFQPSHVYAVFRTGNSSSGEFALRSDTVLVAGRVAPVELYTGSSLSWTPQVLANVDGDFLFVCVMSTECACGKAAPADDRDAEVEKICREFSRLNTRDLCHH